MPTRFSNSIIPIKYIKFCFMYIFHSKNVLYRNIKIQKSMCIRKQIQWARDIKY